jgi:hypothetical protein
MYFDTHIEYKHQIITDFIENEMQRYQKIAEQAISCIAHFEKEIVLRILAYSFIEENEDAIKLAYKLNLGKLEFLACIDDYDSFKDLYMKEQEKQYEHEIAQNF